MPNVLFRCSLLSWEVLTAMMKKLCFLLSDGSGTFFMCTDPPVCDKGPKETNIFGAAIHEETLVTCRVDAEPEAKSFRWAFNNSATKLEISREHYSKEGLSSTVRYQPFSELDYGSLLCWATNEIGTQEIPCVYHIIYVGEFCSMVVYHVPLGSNPPATIPLP